MDNQSNQTNQNETQVEHTITSDEAQRIHSQASALLKMCMDNCGAQWKNVVVEMYRRVVADSYGDLPSAKLNGHFKTMRKAVDELIQMVKKMRENKDNSEQNNELPESPLSERLTEN
jgi:hypothetical protein